MKIVTLIFTGLLVAVNVWSLIVVLAYSAAHSMTHLNSYVAVTKRLLNNHTTTSGYLFQLIKTSLTLPLLGLLVVFEFIALFIETFNLVRKKPRIQVTRKEANMIRQQRGVR